MQENQELSPFEYLLTRIQFYFNISRADTEKLKKSLEEKEVDEKIKAFLADDDQNEAIFVLPGSGSMPVKLDLLPPSIDQFKKKGLRGIIVMKLVSHLTKQNVQQELLVVEMNARLLEHLYSFFNEIMSPVVQNPINQTGWTDLVTKDLMEKFNSYIAQVFVVLGLIKRKTLLPIPYHKLDLQDNLNDKDKIHVYEGSIITWTKQIKNILKMEPEQVLKLNNDAGPLNEILFWKHKAENLNSIFQQLNSKQIQTILNYLEQCKSTYKSDFQKLVAQVNIARQEANDNCLYLGALEKYFKQMIDLPSDDFIHMHYIFIPIMHIILNISTKSKFYDTPQRLVILIREICNEIIQKAKDHGDDVWDSINDPDLIEGACQKLINTIDVCNKFKDTYFDYKTKANSSWRLKTNALFVRLDSFIERCQDTLHLTNTILQFNKLDKIDVGGTKGKTLTQKVQQIYLEFRQAVDKFSKITYKILDINKKEFDDDFYQFRSKIKELERRLASLISQGFDDNDTLTGRFKLLDAFEGVLNRPLIQDELEKKHVILLEMFKSDLKAVQSLFIEGKPLIDQNSEYAPLYQNMPPVAGALTWCKSLKKRISRPLALIQGLDKSMQEREEFKDVKKLQESITANINSYEDEIILKWEKDVQMNTHDKLKKNLLTKDENGLLKVNFDLVLLKLLREVKYLKQLDMTVPQTAEEIYMLAKTYRKQIVSLDLIVANYNSIITSMHPVEEPLVKKNIIKMEQEILPGIETIKWKDENIDEYIQKSKQIVDVLFETVNKMKDCLKRVSKCLETFNTKIIERKTKPINPEEYDQQMKAIFSNKLIIVKEQGSLIHKLLKEVLDAVKADQKSQQWKNYTDYVNTIVIDGISTSIQTALRHLIDQIDPTYIKKCELPPLFEIKLQLEPKGVVFDPEIQETQNGQLTVRNIIKNWINDFFSISNNIQRLDSKLVGDYLQEIRTFYFEIKDCLSLVQIHLNFIEEKSLQHISQYELYSYLWTDNEENAFERFLTENEPKVEIKEDDSEVPGENPLLKNCRGNIPSMELFEKQIIKYKTMQQDIQRLPSSKDIFWIRVNIVPLKTQLEQKVSKWKNTYTNFLEKEFRQTLKNLNDFIGVTNEGIQIDPESHDDNGDTSNLMKVMKIISDVKEIENKADTKDENRIEKVVKGVKNMVNQLKSHGLLHSEKGQEDPIQLIENAYNNFKDTSKKVFEKYKSIIKLKELETQVIKNKLDAFRSEVTDYRKEFLEQLPFNYDERLPIDKITSNYDLISKNYKVVNSLDQKSLEYNNLERLFELQKSQYKNIKECFNDLKNLKIMWDAIAMVNYQFNDWKRKPWRQIKADVLLETNKTLAAQLKALSKEIKAFKGYQVIVDKVKNMSTVLPLVQSLLSENMEDRHWAQLKAITGRQFDQNSPVFTFENILELNLYKFEVQVNEIVDVAQKEAKIEKKLKAIEQNWIKQIFEFQEYRDTPIFAQLDQMMELLDQNSLDLMGMKSQGKYVEFFLDKVETWREKLTRVDAVVNEWLKVQKNWKILVNIFLDSDDIRQQLPEDTKNFENVDKEFKEIMNETKLSPSVVDACSPDRKEVLLGWSLIIKKCEKSLNDYLEQKKKSFPRFYFLSNQSLLTILSNGQNAPKVCEYLGDCFDGLKTLVFKPPQNPNETPKVATAMLSKDDERIEFSKDFTCEQAVETWLSRLEYKMRETLQEILDTAKSTSDGWEANNDNPRAKWIEGYCAQIALLVTQIVWTEDVQRAFEDLQGGSESAMKECRDTILKRLAELISKVRGDMHILERLKVINIITIDVHSRDVVEKFVLQKVQEVESFAWLAQLKFYWDSKSDADMAQRQSLRFAWEKEPGKSKCIIRIVDWFRFYSYEYIGNALRLVVTPLTDRCYITLTQALNLTMGGAPAGPAGTGKTETTKDLGRAVGLPVIVFNCSDQMNKDSMAQIFMGLSQSGAWGCFDEFNRISIEVLSVVSSQVKCVLDAMKEKKIKFSFLEEGEINLEDSVGFFITMNPGYAGRTELPENLKALFRSCAMVVPDLVLICENMLMSEGFMDAKALSRKFVSLYMLSRELLSKQKHYDWGLRAVKSVLRQAGKLKRQDPELQEDPLLMRALRDFNLPKIVTDDRPIFVRLIKDLFPKIDPPSKTDPEFKKFVSDTAKRDLGLVNEEIFVLKVVQLAEILEVRHCCFVIGPPGCGKTTVWKTLCRTYCNKGEPCEYDTLNPKAVTSDELFGAYTKSKEWRNGVLSCIMRNQVKNEDKYRELHKHKYSILDGDIDPEWIESLNTVMDDNKVLTLVSNDRIPLSPAMRLLFEVSNLKNATPATVSRAGVLFINESDIGWMPYMNSWLERSQQDILKNLKEFARQLPESPIIEDVGKSMFIRCFQSYVEQNSDIHDKNKVKHIVPIPDIALVQTICTILDSLLIEHGKHLKDLADQKKEEELRLAYEAFFIFAGIWAVGGPVGGGQDEESDMKSFSSFWKSLAKVKFPEQGTCYDYFYNVNENAWVSWSTKVEPYVPNDEIQIFSKIYVPTVHTTRLKYMLDIHQRRKKDFLLVGSAGTGKTAVVKDYLSQVGSDKGSYKTVNFSSFTDSLSLQKQIESMVEKKTGKTFGSSQSKIIICYIDDLNMPYVDKYGTQSPIQLLRQIIDCGSIFNREQLEERKYLEDLLFFACMNQKSGSFNIDLRLQRGFSCFTMYTPSNDIIKTIFSSILRSHLITISDKIAKYTDLLIDGITFVFNKLIKDTQFSPSARKFHYQFNFREIAKVVEGLLRTQSPQYKDFKPISHLWVHEMKRVFEDRFINTADQDKFRRYISDFIGQDVTKSLDDPADNIMQEPNIFTSFISVHKGNDPVYERTDLTQLKIVLEEKLTEYNEQNAQMNLVLFKQALEHIAKICRILDMPGGNALLVGVGGSGKQSLTRLSTFIQGWKIEALRVTASFTLLDLRNNLQDIYKKIAKAGAGPVVFMLTDTQIKEETFLIPINDMLNSGWISDLFPKEEFDGLVQANRNEAKAAGAVDNYDGLSNYFLDKMRKNMKVVLCFSPVGEGMRVRSRKFPGLINATSIDWFQAWPKDALVDVANRFLKDIEFETKDMAALIANNMAEVHSSIDAANAKFLKLERRHNYTTPKSFLELIDFYKSLLQSSREKITKDINKYDKGLAILSSTKQKVEGLQIDLKSVVKEVNKEKLKTEKLIKQVGEESAKAEVQQNQANEQEKVTNEAAQKAEQIKKVAIEALEEALPALKRAQDAVSCLQKQHIQEMKSLGSPPPGVMLTAKLTLILLKEKVTLNDAEDKVWKKAQQIMNLPQVFIDKIKDFKGEEIDQNILDQVNKVIDDPTKKFNEKDMQTQSFAASKLCAWAVNIVTYNKIYKKVKPLQDKKDDAIKEVEQKLCELKQVQDNVAQLNEKVASCRKNLQEAENAKRKVEENAANLQNKLSAAEKLVNGLAGENERWGKNIIDLRSNKRNVVGNSLLASSFVSYIGAFSSHLRLELWKMKWFPEIENQKIPMTPDIRPLRILSTDSLQAKWRNQGLPADPMSLENAAIITSCSRWPLIIDPQIQGSSWIKGSYSENIQIISISQNKWLLSLTQSISMGKVVLLEGIQEEIDATLDPLLQRSIKKQGTQKIIEIGGDPVDYDDRFKLFLMTKLINPHFRPEIAASCTIINFIVTESGLEEQLLAVVVNQERSELEQQRSELVKKQNEFQLQLYQLEANLLDSLETADPETILENQGLIDSLDETKKTSTDIQLQSEQAKITEVEINHSRETYRVVASEGAMLYFLVISLQIIDHMYQYSLEQFETFFLKAINNTKEKGEGRTPVLIQNIRETIYQWISRGLFEKHKLIFLTLIVFRLMQKKVLDVQYEQAEMDFLIKMIPKPGVENNLDWLPNANWDNVQGLIQLEEFKSFSQNMEKDAPTRFRDWYNEVAPEDQKLPLDWKKLDTMPFKKLLVLRCLRPDRITTALTTFIKQTLPSGETFVEMDQKLAFTALLDNVIKVDAEANIPIFFILSPGSDPVKEVEKIAKKEGIIPGKTFFNIALGQGQEEIARRRIQEGNKEGHWVMLQNIHLMPKWLIELEKILDAFKGESGGNQQFRLFLSAEPSDGIPIGVLDRSIKLTNEPPAGLKANMKRAWTYFSKEDIEEKDTKIKSILFSLCFFHSTLIERRRFGAQGWNMMYPFNMGDLRDSYLVMTRYMDQNTSGKVPFDDLIYIFGEIMYGGHIVDDWDRRLCNNYLQNQMHEGLFDELELFPFIEGKGLSFKVPGQNPYEKYLEHIETSLQQETPLAYGLHPNAEINFRTSQCIALFQTLVEIQPKDSGDDKGGETKSSNDIALELIKFLFEDSGFKDKVFNLEDIKNKLDIENKDPYQNVFLQEIEYMNFLLVEMVKSLEDIEKGFQGLLTISEKMEQVIDAIALNRVPTSWQVLAYPSKRGLTSWLQNLFQRIDQLNLFRDDPTTLPKVIMISRFFNPQSFLTAIMQVIGGQKQQELNKLYIQTEITKRTLEQIDQLPPPKEGQYVFGFILQGARWDEAAGCLEESEPKKMYSVLPIVYCKSTIQPQEGKEEKNIYQCPAYKTEDRGNTYVFTAQLKTKHPPRKWILGGVAIIMDIEGVSDDVKKEKDKKQ